MGVLLEPWAWSEALCRCANLKERLDKCDHTMLTKLHWWQRSFFLTNGDLGSNVHRFVLGVVVEAPMHVYLWDAKGSDLYMPTLIGQLRDKDVPVTTRPLGFSSLG